MIYELCIHVCLYLVLCDALQTHVQHLQHLWDLHTHQTTQKQTNAVFGDPAGQQQVKHFTVTVAKQCL